MKVLCISAANTKDKGRKSASIKVCDLIKNNINEAGKHEVSILPLVDYDLKNCELCGKCSKNQKCYYDKNFNIIYDQLTKHDLIIFVVPHYSPIPSKLLMIFEKINEINYASWLNNPNIKVPTMNKKVGIIGHGGMVENEKVLNYYHDHLVTPIAASLRSLGFSVNGFNDIYPNGCVFGLKDENSIRKNEDNIFPDIIQDYEMIEKRIIPFINTILEN